MKYPGSPFMEQLKEIIYKNLDNPDFSIKLLCRQAGVSRTQLHRNIKSATGLSTSLFIRQCRLHKAKELLETTDLNISEVAYKVGSNNPQNFSKYFSKEFGVSPSKYRKNFQESRQNSETEQSKTPAGVPDTDVDMKGDGLIEKGIKKRIITPTGIVSLVILIAGSLGIFGWIQYLDYKRNLLSSQEPDFASSIAVVPFQNTGWEENTFLSEGIVEDIITNLGKIKNLRVISSTSSAKYKNTNKSIKQIADELDVEYILEGSIRQAENNVRINAQLIRVADDFNVWSNYFDYKLEDVIQLQSKVAGEIATALQQNINPEIRLEIEQVPTNNIDAYNAMLRGRYLLQDRTKEGLESSIMQFDLALKLDPEFSEAYTGKAAAYNFLVDLGYVPEGKEKEYIELAEENALFAIKENVKNAQAYAILGNIYREQYRWKEAITAYKIALDLNPNDALANYWYSLILRSTGDLTQALTYHRIASKLDPLYPVIHAGHIHTCNIAGKYEMAEKLMEEGEPVFKNSFLFSYTRASNLYFQGKFEEALPYLEQCTTLNPGFWGCRRDKMYCLGKSGENEEVFTYLDTLDISDSYGNMKAAMAWAGLGDDDKTLSYLEKAAELGRIPEDLLVDPVYRHLHGNPRFVAILEKFGLVEFRTMNQ